MKKSIVIASPCTYLPVFEELKNKGAISPSVWICQEKYRSSVNDAFSGLDVLDPTSNLIYGELFDKERQDKGYENINKKILESFLPCQRVLMEMMITRSDSGGGFGYYEALGVYHNYLINAFHLLDLYDADLIFFQEIPHNMWDYVLYEVAKYKKVKCLMLLDTPYDGYLVVYSDLNSRHLFSSDLEEKNVSVPDLGAVAKKRKDYIGRLRGTFEAGSTYQFKQTHGANIDGLSLLQIEKRLKVKKRKESYFFLKAKLQKLIGMEREAGLNYLKQKGLLWRESCITKSSFFSERIGHIDYRLLLLNIYKKKCTPFDSAEKFVYFPLHKQPELSTVPMAGFFSDQLLALKMLHSALPDDYRIIIKENPHQFEWHRGGFARHLTYYDEMYAMERVQFVDTGVDSYGLIDKCEFVYTAVGTAGWEAIVRGKSVIISGNCVWYYRNRQAYTVSSVKDIKKALNRIHTDTAQSLSELESFLADFERSAFFAVTSRLHQSKLKVKNQENQKKLVETILKSCSR